MKTAKQFAVVDERVTVLASEIMPASRTTPENTVAAASILVLFVLQVAFAFRLNINWDEYFFLSHIYSAIDGRLSEPLQTFYVHLLWWVAALPLNEADQIVAGRLFMALCEIVSLACLYRIAREFASPREALLACLAYLASGYVLAHGISFRADPLAAMLMMAALALLFTGPERWWKAVLSGAIAALGLLVTIKCAFYLPAFAAALLWRWHKSTSLTSTLAHFGVAGLVLAVVGSLLFIVHANGIVSTSVSATAAYPVLGSAASSADSALHKVILSQGLFPRLYYIKVWLGLSALPLILIALGAYSALRDCAGEKLRGLTLLILLLPLLTLAFYRNAFPYFFPFLFLPPAVLVAVGLSRFPSGLTRAILFLAMGLVVAIQAAKLWPLDQFAQRSVAGAAHMAFPEAVPYIDRNGMLPSFPKANQFMSTWGVDGMLSQGIPVVLPLIESKRPPLLVANSPVLEAALGQRVHEDTARLHPTDELALRSNYIQHWGPLWVAGKTLEKPSGRFEMLISGTYTLECAGSRSIDGAIRICGSTVDLAKGAHRWDGGAAVLRWGENLPRPAGTPPDRPIYYGF